MTALLFASKHYRRQIEFMIFMKIECCAFFWMDGGKNGKAHSIFWIHKWKGLLDGQITWLRRQWSHMHDASHKPWDTCVYLTLTLKIVWPTCSFSHLHTFNHKSRHLLRRKIVSRVARTYLCSLEKTSNLRLLTDWKWRHFCCSAK